MLYIFPKDISPKFISFWTFFYLICGSIFPPIKQCPSPLASFSVNLLSLWLSRWQSGKKIYLPKQETLRHRIPFLVLGRSPGEGNGNPLQYSFLGNSMDRGAWRASVHGITKNQTKLSYWACTHQIVVLPQLCFFTFQIKVEKADLGSILPGLRPWLQPFLGV